MSLTRCVSHISSFDFGDANEARKNRHPVFSQVSIAILGGAIRRCSTWLSIVGRRRLRVCMSWPDSGRTSFSVTITSADMRTRCANAINRP